MKNPFTSLPWRKKKDEPVEQHPIVFQWQGIGTPYTPYARIRRITPEYYDWERLVSRRAKLLSVRDAEFFTKDRRRWTEADLELAAIWGELLQAPTHCVEMGFHRGEQRHRFFREGFNFGMLEFFESDYVAREIGKFLVSMFERLDISKRQKSGTLADLRDEWHQVYCLANILASYKFLRSL